MNVCDLCLTYRRGSSALDSSAALTAHSQSIGPLFTAMRTVAALLAIIGAVFAAPPVNPKK